jgi:hypothetical protein
MASPPRKARRSSKGSAKRTLKPPAGGWASLWKRNLEKAQKRQAEAIKKGRKNLKELWKKNLGRAQQEQAKARAKKGLTPQIPILKRVVKTTRATAANVAIRDRLADIQDILEKILSDPNKTEAEKQAAREALDKVKQEKERQRTDPRAAVPVGMVQQSGLIDIDRYRGGIYSFALRNRNIHSGKSLLGTMEGWSHIVTVISAEPFGSPLPEGWTPVQVPSDVMARIRDLPQLNGIPDSEKEQWVQRIAYLWSVCEERGAVVTFEMDYPDTKGKK